MVSVSNKLIIFVKNPVPGKVKTRIAATAGDENALVIYHQLLEFTKHNTQSLEGIQKFLFYSDEIEQTEEWPSDIYTKQLQVHGDLGHKMKMAFKEILNDRKKQNKTKALIIGSDCPELSESIILQAFDFLDNNDVVIGPTFDGGYYLLGMKGYFPILFDGIAWSTEDVFDLTIQIIKEQNLSFATLPTLNDIDTEDDWNAYQKRSISVRDDS